MCRGDFANAIASDPVPGGAKLQHVPGGEEARHPTWVWGLQVVVPLENWSGRMTHVSAQSPDRRPPMTRLDMTACPQGRLRRKMGSGAIE